MAVTTDCQILVDAPISEDEVKTLISKAWGLFDGQDGARVEVVLMGVKDHTLLHKQFLDDSTETDVMAFPYGDADLFGELLVNVDMARLQAETRGLAFGDELRLYIVHGCLHLLGFDDHCDDDRKKISDA